MALFVNLSFSVDFGSHLTRMTKSQVLGQVKSLTINHDSLLNHRSDQHHDSTGHFSGMFTFQRAPITIASNIKSSQNTDKPQKSSFLALGDLNFHLNTKTAKRKSRRVIHLNMLHCLAGFVAFLSLFFLCALTNLIWQDYTWGLFTKLIV
jgi:hypothetical protein